MKMTSILSLIVMLLVPIALLGFGLRVLLTPLFYTVEYNLPYFPPDEYGFTKADRLKWAPYAVTYLVNSADISYLGDLKFDDGLPIYTERELSHMHDVKRVTQSALRVWYVTLVLLIGLGAWSKFGRFDSAQQWEQAFRQGLMRGGWLMVGLAVVIGLIAVIGMSINPDLFFTFFTWFHQLFFEGNSWLFLYSDTLIRLFPIRFWEDAFLWAAVIALGGGVGLGLGLRR